MRIDGPGSREIDPASRNTDRPGVSSPFSTGDTTENSTHAISNELRTLLDKVSSLPDVRPEVVTEATRRLNAGALNAVLNEKQTRDKLAELSIKPTSGTPEEAMAFAASEAVKWKKVIEDGNIKPE